MSTSSSITKLSITRELPSCNLTFTVASRFSILLVLINCANSGLLTSIGSSVRSDSLINNSRCSTTSLLLIFFLLLLRFYAVLAPQTSHITSTSEFLQLRLNWTYNWIVGGGRGRGRARDFIHFTMDPSMCADFSSSSSRCRESRSSWSLAPFAWGSAMTVAMAMAKATSRACWSETLKPFQSAMLSSLMRVGEEERDILIHCSYLLHAVEFIHLSLSLHFPIWQELPNQGRVHTCV